MATYAEIARTHSMTMDATYIGLRAEKDADGKVWPHFVWKCTLRNGRLSYTTTYRMGIAHCKPLAVTIAHVGIPRERMTQEIARALNPYGRVSVSDLEGYVRPTAPELAEVLQSLASDASGVVSADSFAEWCAEYGYSTDSRNARRTYKACKEVYFRLSRLLGAYIVGDLFEATEE